ncbi:glycosyltransferase family 4 protein [Sphingomonas sp. 3-13AW]|uniref:glycosyltransferase family 4 protein n=1 Tax=Sphingomonas sp. 3-13AW TaxID=3050450 RepID=UPI003BB6A72B
MNRNSGRRFFITPSLKITGGNLEIIRLARELSDQGVETGLIVMWRASHEAETGGLPVVRLSDTIISPRVVMTQLPLVAWNFRRLMTQGVTTMVFSHYVTFPLVWLVSLPARWFFVQDTEWLFVHGARKQSLLRRFIISMLRGGKVISANRYLTGQMKNNDVLIECEVPIWANPLFFSDRETTRDIDVAVMLRRGAHKRSDLTLSLIDELATHSPGIKIAVISPDETYRSAIPGSVRLLERASIDEMRSLYERTKVFALLSDHEGFGLPPLEAMGSGCVPICRDAGGVNSYMTGDLSGNVIPLETPVSEIAGIVLQLLRDEDRRCQLSQAARAIFLRGQDATAGRVSTLLAAGF